MCLRRLEHQNPKYKYKCASFSLYFDVFVSVFHFRRIVLNFFFISSVSRRKRRVGMGSNKICFKINYKLNIQLVFELKRKENFHWFFVHCPFYTVVCMCVLLLVQDRESTVVRFSCPSIWLYDDRSLANIREFIFWVPTGTYFQFNLRKNRSTLLIRTWLWNNKFNAVHSNTSVKKKATRWFHNLKHDIPELSIKPKLHLFFSSYRRFDMWKSKWPSFASFFDLSFFSGIYAD